MICLVHFISILREAQNLVWEAGCRNHKGGRVGPGSECQRRVRFGEKYTFSVCWIWITGFSNYYPAINLFNKWLFSVLLWYWLFHYTVFRFLICPKYFLYSLVALEAEHFSILILSRTGLPLLFSKFCDCVIWSFFMWNLEALYCFFKFKFCWSANQSGA